MNAFEARLAEDLLPEYELRDCLGRGGMGAVYRAWQPSLRRYVAVKALHIDRATEIAVQRFKREARILAELDHPNIVTVHAVSSRGGAPYYIMQHVEGQTLAERLAAGPMAIGDVRKLGRDLLDALEVAHGRGIVHRDIKPGNIMLTERGAVLVDFGIARSDVPDAEILTETGTVLGTLAYMAPEQFTGAEPTPQTDLHAVAAVLYEAVSGRRWEVGAINSWRRVPRSLRKVLVRGLAARPEDRWRDAAAFRAQLTDAGGGRGPPVVWAAAATVVAVIVVYEFVIANGPDPPFAGVPHVSVDRFEYRGIPSLRWTADSVAARVGLTLQAVPDFRVTTDPGDSTATIVLTGSVDTDERGVTVRVWSTKWEGLRLPIRVTDNADAWVDAADSVAIRTMRELWSESNPLADWLPVEALPTDPWAFGEWVGAFTLLGEGRWSEAYRKLRGVVAIDSACVYCSWWITEIQRWRLEPPDSIHRARALAGSDVFPPHYQRLIRARLATDDRLDSLEAVARDWPGFYYASFLLGEEKFNRGPLYGLPRAAAVEDLERAARLRPQFAPIWWDLAWIRIAERDTVGARAALGALPDVRDPMAASVMGLLQIAYAFAFLGRDETALALEAALGQPAIRQNPNTPAAPRLMASFDLPGGAVFLGELFVQLGVGGGPQMVQLSRSGLVAQMLGLYALGRLDSAAAVADVYRREYIGDAEMELFWSELQAVTYLIDPAVAPPRQEIADALQHVASSGNPRRAERARWMYALVSDDAAEEPVPLPSAALDAHLRAVSHARNGRYTEAIDLLASQRRYRIADSVPDPFYRTVVSFQLADWAAAIGDSTRAAAALRFHEAFDLWGGHPTEHPIAQEVDWAFATMARWRRAQLLNQLGEHQGEVCSAYAKVARHWQGAPSPYGARAEAAGRRHAALQC